MSVGTITTSGSTQRVLEICKTERGAVDDARVVEEEELTAPGVDGRRWRTVGVRYRPFTATIMETATTYTAAVIAARAYDGMVGTTISLSVTLDSVAYVFERVHVIASSVRAAPGVVAGSTAGSTHAAYVMGDLRLVVIEQEDGSSP